MKSGCVQARNQGRVSSWWRDKGRAKEEARTSSTGLFHFFSAISNKSFVRETRVRSYLGDRLARERQREREESNLGKRLHLRQPAEKGDLRSPNLENSRLPTRRPERHYIFICARLEILHGQSSLNSLTIAVAASLLRESRCCAATRLLRGRMDWGIRITKRLSDNRGRSWCEEWTRDESKRCWIKLSRLWPWTIYFGASIEGWRERSKERSNEGWGQRFIDPVGRVQWRNKIGQNKIKREIGIKSGRERSKKRDWKQEIDWKSESEGNVIRKINYKAIESGKSSVRIIVE